MIIAPERVHVVVLRVAGNETHGLIAALEQIIRQTRVQIRIHVHDRFGKIRHKTVMNTHDAVVGMNTGGIAVRPIERLIPQTAQIGSEVLPVLFAFQVLGSHRLHEDQHHVRRTLYAALHRPVTHDRPKGVGRYDGQLVLHVSDGFPLVKSRYLLGDLHLAVLGTLDNIENGIDA